MELKDSGSVVLTAYHPHTSSRTKAIEQTRAPPLSAGSSSLSSRKVNYKKIFRMISQESLSPPSIGRSISQESLDSNSMEDYWSEVKSIEEGADNTQEDQVFEVKSVDESEQDEAWLNETGLSMLVSGVPEKDCAEALLSTLTRKQAAVVQKRLDNYTQTLRMKYKQPVRDVRDIFSGGDSPTGFGPGAETTKHSKSISLPFKLPLRVPGGLDTCTSNCQLNSKDNSLSTEELNLEVPFSECVSINGKTIQCCGVHRIKRDEATLPKFTVRKARLGCTIIRDLSPQDMKKIACLSLIELTAYYDALGIELKRNRAVRVKARETGLFGVPLSTLIENDQKKFPGSTVPQIFKKLLSRLEQTGLQTEGILRIPGSASRVKNLRQELEAKFYDDTFNWDQVRHNDAAGLLKLFIRELPYPLLTVEYLPAFAAVDYISSPRLQLHALHLLIMLLPEAHRNTLKNLLNFLSKVVANEDKNRMSLWNVSMIVAPNLFMYKGKSTNPQEIQGSAGGTHLVRLLVKYQDILWTVPLFMIDQVRKMNEASTNKKQQTSDKSRRKFFQKWNAERDKIERTEQREIPEGVIRVHAPLHAKVSMAIQLDSETKAKDVVARFDCENSSAASGSKQKQYLFEVGGNIGERRLDPETFLLDLYHVNPQCEWYFKPQTT
ncbi:rho GTPase-activating protein 28 [Polypterus senegalus]|uniref:rho GTPase-activating protein 28 n=1 Tax=Polypterus senegalus TaxID=55291 RepID=UPI001965BDC8|nr:rho GTPase-activating protein 28 [Polypterus senegalus]